MGITTWDDAGEYLRLSLTLGGAEGRPLELTGSYATLANNGQHVPLEVTRKVVECWGGPDDSPGRDRGKP